MVAQIARWTTRAAVPFGAALLGMLLGCDAGSDKVRIVAVDTESQANEVLVALDTGGIGGASMSAVKQGRAEIWEVRVPRAAEAPCAAAAV